MDGRGIAASLVLGASAVQMGTAFLSCEEAGVPKPWLESLLNSHDQSTVLTKVFSGKLLGDITPYDLEKFRNERKDMPVKSAIDKVINGLRIREKHPVPSRERKVSTVNRELSTLRHMFSKAIEWGMMESSPFMKVKKLLALL